MSPSHHSATQNTQTSSQVPQVVYETTSSGTILDCVEAQRIESYLSRKYFLLDFSLSEIRLEEANKLGAEVLAMFITILEQRIEENGNNGHHVGSKAFLADLKTSPLIDRLTILWPKEAHLPLSEELAPGLWKVHQAVKNRASPAA
ncbi:hypothetical protein BGZ92_006170 [Podila epicladia]|nr:hypothetical protein BGZ92_006170 [Podila epicladia]